MLTPRPRPAATVPGGRVIHRDHYPGRHPRTGSCPSTMSNSKIGGEYGEVRANIDAAKLNAYLTAHVPAVKAPVDIKQFKVRAELAQGCPSH